MLTIHDIERAPSDRLTCQWGALSSILGGSGSAAGGAAAGAGTAAAGAGAGAAAGGLGSTLANAGSALAQYGGQLAQSTGVPTLYQAAANALGGGQAGYLQSLGQAVPQGVEMGALGDPGFFQGLAQGFTGTVNSYLQPGAGTQFGQGLGMLGAFVDQNRGGPNAGALLRSALEQYGLGPSRFRSVSSPALGNPGLLSAGGGGRNPGLLSNG